MTVDFVTLIALFDINNDKQEEDMQYFSGMFPLT